MMHGEESSGGRLASHRTDKSVPQTVRATDYGNNIGEGFKMPFSSRLRVASEQETDRIMHNE